MSKGKKKKRAEIEKGNIVLEKLEVVYVGIDDIKPNSYNPNRQSEHDFALLCKSIAADGFTQPVIVNKNTKEIVDGEHRWRACKALGFDEVPIVWTEMTPEQARISTLRHNRARGSEDAGLAAEVIQELLRSGNIEYAKDELGLDDVELKRLLEDMPKDEVAELEIAVTEDMLGPTGRGMSELDKTTTVDLTADERRAKERVLQQAKRSEEKEMGARDGAVYRLTLIFTGDEAALVRRALDGLAAEDEKLPQTVLTMCQRELERLELETTPEPVQEAVGG